MNDENTLNIIESLQKKLVSQKITIGSTIGIILIIYFFTFAMLVDKFPPVFFVFEGISSIIFVIILFTLNKTSYALLKMRSNKNSEQFRILEKMQPGDVDKKPEEVFNTLNS